MTLSLHNASFAAAVAATFLASTVQGRAEVNRVLPFWAQPYPTGFVRVEDDYTPRAPRCRVWRRVHTDEGIRTVAVDRCRSVLHARD